MGVLVSRAFCIPAKGTKKGPFQADLARSALVNRILSSEFERVGGRESRVEETPSDSDSDVATSKMNSTLPSTPANDLPTYSTKDFLIGLAIVLGASVLNAFGLNLTKLDHARNTALPKSSRRADYLRPLWVLGLLAYVVSQLVGSSLALEYLRSEYVAPLSASSLIFNFLFAYLLVKTPITRLDLLGTSVIVAGVIGVIVAGNHRSATSDDVEARLDLNVLKSLWAKPAWIAYFAVMELLTVVLYWLASIAQKVWDEREELEEAERNPEERYGLNPRAAPEGFWASVKARQKTAAEFLRRHMARWAETKPDPSVKKALGFLWAVNAGILSGQTLIFGKSVCVTVPFRWCTSQDQLAASRSSQATRPRLTICALLLSSDLWRLISCRFIILLILVLSTAILQIVCLNRGSFFSLQTHGKANEDDRPACGRLYIGSASPFCMLFRLLLP